MRSGGSSPSRHRASSGSLVQQRVISFALVVGVGFLLLTSLLVSAGLAAAYKYMGQMFPGVAIVWEAANVIVSLFVITLLFAMIYKVLPDVKLDWRDVWVGALVTAGLFTIGKFLIGLYLGTSSFASSYGAAGSVIVLLLWVYYSSQVILLGAEFTRAYVEQFGPRPPPTELATETPIPISHRSRDARVPSGWCVPSASPLRAAHTPACARPARSVRSATKIMSRWSSVMNPSFTAWSRNRVSPSK